MHGVRTALLEEQSTALNLPLQKVLITKDSTNDEFELKMRDVLQGFKNRGVSDVVFGDIFLEDLRKYREDNMAKLDMNAIFPLWKKDTKLLAQSFIDSGFKAIITCVDTKVLDDSFAGREFNNQLLSDLPSSVDAGPIFEKQISVTRGEVVLRDERFCFCDLLPA
jgi:diphthamide synthase (EF-2-diphthine--ammonia ligase)